jgi:hypothetical protein
LTADNRLDAPPLKDARPTTTQQPLFTPAVFGKGHRHNVPAGFRALIGKGKISVEVARILGRIQRALESPGQLDKLPKMGVARDDFQEVFPALGSLQHDGEPTIDSLLSMGLIMYCVLELSDLPVWQTLVLFSTPILELRGGLTLQLLGCERLRDVEEEVCLRWLFELTIGSWKDRSHTIAGQGSDLLESFRTRFQDTDDHGSFFELKKTQFDVVPIPKARHVDVANRMDDPKETPIHGNSNTCQLLTIDSCWEKSPTAMFPDISHLQTVAVAA